MRAAGQAGPPVLPQKVLWNGNIKHSSAGNMVNLCSLVSCFPQLATSLPQPPIQSISCLLQLLLPLRASHIPASEGILDPALGILIHEPCASDAISCISTRVFSKLLESNAKKEAVLVHLHDKSRPPRQAQPLREND